MNLSESPQRTVCTNADHDHAMTCGDCGKPMHYDRGVEDYVHDAHDVSCFLIQERHEGATDCEVGS